MFQLNQRIKTHKGEIGVIEKECTRPEWDWWVKIQFTAKGKGFECLEPYKESELELYEDKSDSTNK